MKRKALISSKDISKKSAAILLGCLRVNLEAVVRLYKCAYDDSKSHIGWFLGPLATRASYQSLNCINAHD